MANCVDCSCEQVKVGYEACNPLHEMNDSKVKGASQVLADTELCDYPKVFPKALYSIWCVFKNIIAQICWIISELKRIWDEINKIWRAIDGINDMLKKLCQIIANMSNPQLQTLLFTKTSKVSTDMEWLGPHLNNPAVVQSAGVGIAWARLDKPSCEGGNDGYYEWLSPYVSWQKLNGVSPGDLVGYLSKAEVMRQTGNRFTADLWNQLVNYSSLYTSGFVTRGHISTEWVIDVTHVNGVECLGLFYWGAEAPIGANAVSDSLSHSASNFPRIFHTN